MTEEQRLKRNARARKCYITNKEKALQRMRAYQQGDKFKEYSAAYRKENGMIKSEYDALYRKKAKLNKL